MPQRELPIVLIIYLILFLFGVAYNALIAMAEKKATESTGLWQFLDVTTSFQVALGTFVTLIGIHAIDLFADIENRALSISFWAFAASGIPMIYGSLRRYAKHLSAFFWRRFGKKQQPKQ